MLFRSLSLPPAERQIIGEKSTIDKYGADALRLTLITGNAPGNDMRFYWERVESSRNFANKVWNLSLIHIWNEQYLVRVGDEVTSKADLENLVLMDLGMDGIEPVRLLDVADIEYIEDVYKRQDVYHAVKLFLFGRNSKMAE